MDGQEHSPVDARMRADQNVYVFGPFRMIPAQLLLLRGDHTISLPKQVGELLYVFVTRRFELRDKLALEEEMFGSVGREESTIPHLVLKLRKRLGPREDNQEYIETVPAEGYRLSVAVEVIPPPDDDVDKLCHKGFLSLEKYSEEGFDSAVASFEEALGRDERRVAAHLGRAAAYTWATIFNYNKIPASEALGRAKESARRAAELKPSLPAAHTLCAFSSMCYERDWGRAWEELRKAVGLDPKFAMAHLGLALWHIARGEEEAAVAEIELAHEHGGMSPLVEVIRGFVYFFARREESLGIFQETIKATRVYVVAAFDAAYFGVAHVKAAAGSYAEALAAAKKAYEFSYNILDRITIAYIHARAKRRKLALSKLKELLDDPRKKYVSPYNLATVAAALREHDHAFAWLQAARDGRDPWIICLRADPRFDSLHPDPRFNQLLSDLNLPPL